MSTLTFDTETTGKWDFKAPIESPHQPRIVQLGAVLEDDDGREISSMDLIVKPDGYEISDEVAAIHGIDQLTAILNGVGILDCMAIFVALWNAADRVVAHNIEFDLKMVERELRLQGQMQHWQEKPVFCTMRLLEPVLKLPFKGGKRPAWAEQKQEWKWPSMQEAYAHVTGGKEFDNAHSAMADVRACAEVWRWIVKNKIVTL